MVSATTAISGMRNLANTTAKSKGIKSLGIGGLLTAGFCVFDFLEVPGAFSIKCDYEGKKVDGANIEAGLKETGWSAVKCAAAFAIPGIIGMFATPLGPVLATLATVAKLATPILSYSLLEKIRPHEKEVIQEICQEKGIDINNPDATLRMTETNPVT